jgi:NAD(P)-dependent dehydrogenase (short-subunit alcohol dehydrogenase family)
MSDIVNVKGKKVLITGSGTGIGRGTALAFSEAGADVAVHYSHSAKGAESAVKEIVSAGRKAKAFKADFNSVKEVQQLGKDAIDYLGGIDILINNAGITLTLPFLEVTPEQFDTVYNVNCRAMFFLTQAVAPTMEKQGKGVVINIGSGHGFGGFRQHTVYAGTKGAIVSYSRTLAMELCNKNIRVMCVACGWTRVERQTSLLGDDFDWDKAGLNLPAGFVATPMDMGKFIVCMASDVAKYVVGHTFIVDGGQMSAMACVDDFRKPVKEQYGKGYVPGI